MSEIASTMIEPAPARKGKESLSAPQRSIGNRVGPILSTILVLDGLLVFLIGAFSEWMPVTPLMILFQQPDIFGWGMFLGLFIIMLAIATFRTKPHVRLLLVTTVVPATLIGLGVLLWFPLGNDEGGFRGWMAHNPRYGLVGYPNTQFHNWYLDDFDVHYSFDERGFRRTPDSEPNGGPIVFLGCSFTFGTGCEDHEVFPAVLANKDWNGSRVENYAFPSWGTAHALLALEEVLMNEPLPKAVFYGYLVDHPMRNSLRASWHAKLGGGRTTIPLFHITQGRLRYEGLVPTSRATYPDDEATTLQEQRITIAIILAMQRMCESRGVPFFVVLLGSKHEEPSDDPLPPMLAADGVSLIDVRNVSDSFFEHDPHPTRMWHAAVARSIADDPSLSFLKP